MAKDYTEDLVRLGNATRTHFTHFMVGKIPWHTDDHKFGESTSGGDGEEVKDTEDGPQPVGPNPDAAIEPLGEPGVDEGIDESVRAARDSLLHSTVHLIDSGKCYWCREPATTGYQGRLYCSSCWLASEGDKDDPYGGGA